MRKMIILALLMAGATGFAYASDTASRPDIMNNDGGWITGPARNDVLLIRTTDVALNQAFNELGVAFDEYMTGGDFSGLDLTPYTHVFLAMDGGTPEGPSMSNAATYVNGGGRFHIYGGTCWQAYAAALNQYLLQNDLNNYCWTTVGGSPQVTVVDPGHCLATGLPGTFNFNLIYATYYATRSTDTGASVAAVNGDGYDMLMSKSIGAGTFDICINSAYIGYYTDPNDYGFLKTVVQNMLNCGGSVPVVNTTWGNIKSLFSE